MAITRAQQARQLYRDAGYVEKAYGKATEGATTAPALDAQRSINMSGNFNNNNLDKVANVVGTASDLNRYKTLIEGGGFKSMIPNPVTMGGIFLLNQLRKRNQDVPTLTDEDNTLNYADGGRIGFKDGEGIMQMASAPDPMDEKNMVMETIAMEEFGKPLKDLSEEEIIYIEIFMDEMSKKQNVSRVMAQQGGNVVGGEMDFDSARQMYGLGKLVKKITRSVKKVAKSPIGKAALLYTGLGGLGSMAAGQGFFSNFMSPMSQFSNVGSIFSKQGLGNIASKIGLGTMKTLGPPNRLPEFVPNALGKIVTSPTALITAGSTIAGMLTPEQEEEAQTIANETGIDIAEIRANPDKYLARRFRAEGGSMDEPVAKKTMPLLDMDGQEMDLRAEGGFVPLGRMEKADDVPARLSKNEFVFTAEAVRNAGEGDVDKGAEVMYNMMKNLESGGEVSEESQGLEGAREMFQTSQRLEEVI